MKGLFQSPADLLAEEKVVTFDRFQTEVRAKAFGCGLFSVRGIV